MITLARRWFRRWNTTGLIPEPFPSATCRLPAWRLRCTTPPRPSAWWMLEVEAPRGVRVALIRSAGAQLPVVLGRDGRGKRVLTGIDPLDLAILFPDQEAVAPPQATLVALSPAFARRLMLRKIRLAIDRGHVSIGRDVADPLPAYEQTMKAFATGLLGGDLPDWSANEEALARRDDAIQAIAEDAEARRGAVAGR